MNQNEKITAPSRANISAMKSTGYTSTGRNNRNKEELDQESQEGLARINQNDQEIDQGINEISHGLDQLADIANLMKEEVYIYQYLILIIIRHKVKTENLKPLVLIWKKLPKNKLS